MKPLNKKQYLKFLIEKQRRQKNLHLFYRLDKSISIFKLKFDIDFEKEIDNLF